MDGVISKLDQDRSLAESYFRLHKSSLKSWPFGEIETVWRDRRGLLCIEYKSGNYFQYKVFKSKIVWN